MMDPFSFQEDLLSSDLFWVLSPEPFYPTPAPPPARRSSFVPYTRPPVPPPLPGGATNIHRRVTELLRRIPKPDPDPKMGSDSRGFRHMMRERQRREKLSQSYADLYSMLPSRTKADKNSIVRSAAVYMRELKGTQEALRRRNEELKARLKGVTAGDGGERIRITVANPSSAIDSFIGALRCLKSMDVKASSIRSDFSGEKLSAVVNFETNNKASATELEKAVEGAMEEVEQKFRTRLPRSSGWSRHCHVENTL